MSDDVKTTAKVRSAGIRYEALFENTNDAVFLIDLEGQHFNVNKQAAKMLGYKHQDLIEMSVWEVIAEGEKGKAEGILEKLLERKPVPPYERLFRKADGTEFPVEINVTLVRDSEGNPEYIQSIVRDISARQEIQDALKISEQRHRDLITSLPEGVASVDFLERFKFVNQAFCDLLGYSHEELFEMSATDIVDPDEESIFQSQTELRKQGESSSYEIGMIRKNSDRIIVRISAVPQTNDAGEISGSIAVISDVTAQKQTEAALASSEARFRAVFDQAAVGVAIAAPDGTLLRGNSALEKMLGYESGEMVGTNVFDIALATQHDHIITMNREILAGKRKSYQLETKFRHKDGTQVWGRLVVSIPPKLENTDLFAIGIFQDISREKAAEEALKASEERFRFVFESAALGMTIVDQEDNILDANTRFQEITGYALEELKSMQIAEFTHPDDIEIDSKLFREIEEGKRDSYHMEKRYIRKDGTMVWCNLTLSTVKNDQGDIILTTGMVEDITERKQAEEELRKLSRAIEGSPASVVITDVNGLIEYVNPAFAKLTYYGTNEVVGQNPRILKTDLTSDETHIDLWETITSGRTWNGIFANKKKNGEIYWEDAYISPIFDNDDNITHYVAVKVDITKQREAQELLRISNDELELYTSFLQHDLRNDLQVLMSNAEAGLILGDEEDPLRNYVEIIMATSERMKRVLDVFGYPSGILQADFHNLINSVAEQAQNAHPNLEIQVRNLGMPEEFRIPRGRLLPIVFDNLFRNSARFGGERVNVVVELSLTDGLVQVVVSDDGPGVPEEIRSKLFRKGASTTGSGYGLYLTKKLIEGYNGSISLIESETGEGAKFRIILPLK
ncbi:MAG: PAS domain S-box protein [Candidatus Thorarchaeota archaeon]|nr:PAS domain S-box protein [Candidatus Thorarchaeota archaeon]